MLWLNRNKSLTTTTQGDTMKAQHTPNWELETHYDHNNETRLEVYGRPDAYLHKFIARLYPGCRYADDTDRANARLVVAAPELLAMLEAVVKEAQLRRQDQRYEIYEQAQALVAKVKGE